MPNFSFVSVPFEEAELILKTLNKTRSRNDKPMVEVANSDKGGDNKKGRRRNNNRSKKK